RYQGKDVGTLFNQLLDLGIVGNELQSSHIKPGFNIWSIEKRVVYLLGEFIVFADVANKNPLHFALPFLLRFHRCPYRVVGPNVSFPESYPPIVMMQFAPQDGW